MPRLLSNRKKVTPPAELKESRWDYLGLNQAQPNLGVPPSADTGYTLKQVGDNKVVFDNTLGKLEFENQTIKATNNTTPITVDGDNKADINLRPAALTKTFSNFEVSNDTLLNGKIRVLGEDPKGTFPFVTNTLYVTMDGDDTNDGRAMDSTRACRTISGAIRSPYYQEGTSIIVAAGHYFEDNPIPLKPYTSVKGSDLRTTFVEPLNKDLDLFHVNSGVYIAQMNMLNLRRGSVERYAPGGAGTYTTGAYAVAFPPSLENPIDLYYSPYIQNCTNQSGPWLFDGTMFIPNQTVQVPEAAGTSTWTANQYTLTVHLSTGTIVVGQAINDSANEGYRNAQLLLQANKRFLQNEIVAYVNTTYNGFFYDENKCIRDTGLIVDAISQDLLFNTSSQSTFAGLQYWNQNGYVGTVPGEISTTTRAIEYVSTLAQQVVTKTTGTRYQNTFSQILSGPAATSLEARNISDDFEIILDILNRGTEGISDIIIPNGISASTETDILAAVDLLQGNRSFIQNETIAFIESIKTGFGFDKPKCYRDSGLIVDAIALDLLYPTPGNSQATFSGLQYWSQGSYTGTIANELTTTTNAINYVSALAQKLARNITTGPRYQSTVTQNTSLPSASSAEVTLIANDFSVITDILSNGTDSVSDIIVPNNILPSTVTNVISAYNILQANKEYIQAEAVAFVESTKTPGFVYDQELCYRDVGYMIDSISFDLLHGGNRQAVQSGVYYYSFSTNTAIPNEINETIDAFDFLGNLAQKVIQNVPAITYQNTVTQVFAAYTATYTESAKIYDIVSTITNIIRNGADIVPYKSPISVTSSTNINDTDAARLLIANRDFIQTEVVAYIDQKYPDRFEYDQSKYIQDIGNMIDSVSIDLLYGGNRQAVQTGVYYYSYTTSTAVPNEIPQVTSAYTYISDIVQSVISGQAISPQQSIVPQVVDMIGGTITEANVAIDKISIITDIINNGPTVADDPAPLGITPSSDANVINAAKILQANRKFIQAEVIAYIDNNYFVYNQPLCYRDTGFIIDAIAGDARFGGNQRSIEAGLSYWDGATTLIPGEQTETVSAINYLKDLSLQIIANTTITNVINSVATQVINPSLVHGEIVATRINDGIDIITSIITQGPNATPDPVKDIYALIVPSGLSPDALNTASVVTHVQKITTGTYEVVLNRPTISSSDGATLYFGKTQVYPTLAANIPEEWAMRRLDGHGSGGGALVDGNAPSLKSPIQSFVFDAFTQLNQGGKGIHIINNGYAQLVSVFTIFCSEAVIVENGGIASITNSNANFGDLCLVAKGIGVNEFSGIIHNPSFPSNIPNSEFYPIGYWPQDQRMEVFVPDTANRPHIGLVMEVVPPDTYLDYEGKRVPFVNEQGYPGYLAATSNTGTLTTGSYTISGIDVSNVAIGHTLYIRDIYGEEGPSPGLKYLSNDTEVVDVTYQTVHLSRPILNGVNDPTNPNFLNLFFSGNAYYTVLSSVVDESLSSTTTTKTTLIPGEETTTSLAILYARDLATQIVANSLITGTYQSIYSQTIDPTFPGGEVAIDSLQEKFNIIADIVRKGPDSAPEIIPARQYIQPSNEIKAAKKLLEKNRNFIQAETVAYVDAIWPSKFNYDPVKCARDTGLIVDALAQDLLFNTSSQSTFAGVQYWNQSGYVDGIGGQLTTTTNAIKFVRDISSKIVKNQSVGYTYQTLVTQNLDTPSASESDSNRVISEFNLIVDIIDNGTEGVTDRIIPNSLTASSSSSINNAYTALQANKEFIQAETIAYVNSIADFQYDQAKCLRDTKLIVDAIAFDLKYPTTSNSQSTFAGIQYWNQNGYVGTIQSELTTTTNAIIYLGQLAQQVIVNSTGTRYQYAVAQELELEPATATESAKAGTGFGYIIDILQTGTNGITDIIIPNGQKTYDENIGKAYNLLIANKTFMVEEVIAFIEDTRPALFDYDQEKCRRDMRYMIDSVAFDLLHGGNRQAIQSGVYYYGYNSTSTAIVGEIPQTTAAYNHISSIITSILQSTPITKSPGNTADQVTYMRPATISEVVKAQRFITTITNIINNGPSVAAAPTPISLTESTDPNVDKAFDLLLANRDFIAAEVIAYINSTFTGFEYDQNKCYRDVGYMVDSVSYDLLYGGNRQAIQSGVYYYGFDQYSTAIPNEIPQTTAAYEFIKDIVGDIVTGQIIIPQQTSVVQSTLSSYNEDKCFRDTGIIVDSFITDLLFQGNGYTQSNFSGLQYWNQAGYTGDIANQLTTTTNAIKYLSSLAQQVVLNNTSTVVRFQNTVSQITNLTSATTTQSLALRADFKVITNILTNGTAGVSDIIVANGTTATSVDAQNAYNILIANKAYLQAETLAYVEEAKGFSYDSVKCARDTGLVVEAMALDLAFPTTSKSQSTFAGLQYWNQDGYTGDILSELNVTVSATNYLSQLSQKIAINDTSGPRYQSTATQTVFTTTATVFETASISADFTIITDILLNGTAGVSDLIVTEGTTASSTSTVQTAYDLLVANREYIQAEVVAYVESIKPIGFDYDQAKCLRDTGYMLDSVAFDLLYGGNRQAVTSGVYYYSFNSNSSAIPTEVPQTTDAFNYIKTIAQKIITNTLITNPAQTSVTQFINDASSTPAEVDFVADEINLINSIINDGPQTIASVEPISLTKTTDEGRLNATQLLLSNKEFIKAEVVAYINNKYVFEFDRDKCYRDVGYILDSVAFDILYGGNRQAIQSGVYYYGFSDTASAIPGERDQTIAAYNRLKDILSDIVTNQTVVVSPNNTIAQVKNLATATVSESNLLDNMVDLITGIIYNGPTASQPQLPVGQTRSTSTNVSRAASILAANREFIQEEIVNYVNYTYLAGTDTEVENVRNNIDIITNIISNGPTVAPEPSSIGLTPSATLSTLNGAKLLNANRSFIVAETIAYINNTFNTGFLYDKTKCKRDTGLILDSIAMDILYDSNTQSAFAGLQYWNQSGYTGDISNEITTTTNAFSYMKEIVQKIVLNETVSVSTGNVSTQIVNLTTGTQEAATLLASNMSVIINILENGTDGVSNIIVPNGLVTTDTELLDSFDILVANKTFIEDEVVARISLDNDGWVFDDVKCKRDIGYVIDCIGFDLTHGGNRQSVHAGVYYYGFDSESTAIENEIPQTTAAYEFIKQIIGNIIQGTPVNKTYQRKQKQIVNLPIASSSETTLAYAGVDLITNIINNGPGVAPTPEPIDGSSTPSTNKINAYNMIMANKEFVKAEVIAYIDQTFTGEYNYDKNKCYRDTGAIVDAVIFDIVYGGNYRSVNTGNGYFSRKGQYHIVKLEQNVTNPTLFIDGCSVNFYQQSYISASGYLFEYVGAGTQYGALPQVGTADPDQGKETVQLNNGKVFFTSTDQNGDFRIGPTLVISQSTGVLAGRTFEKSLYATMTPFILVVGS
jgi:hypothetical protein